MMMMMIPSKRMKKNSMIPSKMMKHRLVPGWSSARYRYTASMEARKRWILENISLGVCVIRPLANKNQPE